MTTTSSHGRGTPSGTFSQNVGPSAKFGTPEPYLPSRYRLMIHLAATDVLPTTVGPSHSCPLQSSFSLWTAALSRRFLSLSLPAHQLAAGTKKKAASNRRTPTAVSPWLFSPLRVFVSSIWFPNSVCLLFGNPSFPGSQTPVWEPIANSRLRSTLPAGTATGSLCQSLGKPSAPGPWRWPAPRGTVPTPDCP